VQRPDALDVHVQRTTQPVVIGREAKVLFETMVDAGVAIVIDQHTIWHAFVEHGQNTLA